MAYFKPSVDAGGIHIPTYGDILEQLITDYKGIFGEDVYLEPETPDYQLLSVFARYLDDYSAIAVDVYNARNPNYATGASLDLLLPLNGMSRKPATRSTAILTISGEAGVVLPVGQKAIDTDGYIWSTDEDFTIPAGGSGTVPATCDTPGAIPAPAGTITGIYTPLVGWNAVTNAENATPGTNVETDAEVRARRNLLFNKLQNGTAEAIVSALVRLTGVQFVSLIVNSTDSTDADGIPAHSICAIVKGGENEDVAEAIYKSKAPGVSTYGNTTHNYTDSTGYINPIKFSRPTEIATSATITIRTLSGYDEDRVLPKIKYAIVDEINALGIGKNWGVTTAYRDIYNAFENDCPFIITGITGSNSHGESQIEISCNYDEVLVSDVECITVTVAS